MEDEKRPAPGVTPAEPKKDKGHEQLVNDLRALLAEAQLYEFHDFRNQTYATPKVALAGKLAKMRADVIYGIYDNEPGV